MTEYDNDAIVYPYITKWLRDNTPTDKRLTELEEYAGEHGVPIAKPETASFLSVITSILKPDRILEIGTAIGYSASVMALANEKTEILSLEYDSEIIPVARENIKRLGLSDRVRIAEADANDYLSYLDEDGVFDMIFLDGPKAHYVNMLDDCVRLLKAGGVLVADNVLYKGMTADEEHIIKRKATIVSRLKSYIDALTAHKELKTSLLPLGDGITLSVKLGDK